MCNDDLLLLTVAQDIACYAALFLLNNSSDYTEA